MNKQISRSRTAARVKRYMPLYLMLAPVVLYYLVFQYAPMGGLIIAFKDYNVFDGIVDSPWVGLKYFEQFFTSMFAPRLIRNTLMISLYNLIFGFTSPIILALMFNEVGNMAFKKAAQTISYLPYFISTVVIVSMFVQFLSLDGGLINRIINLFGGESIYFLNEPKYFWGVYTGMNVWKGLGWGTIIYLSSLTGINPELYEACYIDGGGRWRQTWHITLPGISNTIGILLILQLGSVLSVGYESIILMYNPTIYETADVISTYVYRRGLLDADYSFSTAVGMFQSVIGLVLVVISNKLSAKFTEISIW